MKPRCPKPRHKRSKRGEEVTTNSMNGIIPAITWGKQPGRGTRTIHGGAQHRRGITTHVVHHFVCRRKGQSPRAMLKPADSTKDGDEREYQMSRWNPSRRVNSDYGGARG